MKHDERLANDIRNALQSKRCNTNWTQFRSCQAYIGDMQVVTIGNEDYFVTPFRSYDTIVAYIDFDTKVLYEVGKYSQTTSKQVTQYFGQQKQANERVFYKCRTN